MKPILSNAMFEVLFKAFVSKLLETYDLETEEEWAEATKSENLMAWEKEARQQKLKNLKKENITL